MGKIQPFGDRRKRDARPLKLYQQERHACLRRLALAPGEIGGGGGV